MAQLNLTSDHLKHYNRHKKHFFQKYVCFTPIFVNTCNNEAWKQEKVDFDYGVYAKGLCVQVSKYEVEMYLTSASLIKKWQKLLMENIIVACGQ